MKFILLCFFLLIEVVHADEFGFGDPRYHYSIWGQYEGRQFTYKHKGATYLRFSISKVTQK